MVKLINGRGQLGDALRELVKGDGGGVSYPNCVIYHTWNIDDPSEKAQRNEYDKFVKFANAYKDERVFFISTKQGIQFNYLHYKMKAELYLVENLPYGHIVKIPKLIGKGICKDFKEGNILPFCELEEIMTPAEAAFEIMEMLNTDKIMNVVMGTLLDKRTIYDLIQFGVAK